MFYIEVNTMKKEIIKVDVLFSLPFVPYYRLKERPSREEDKALHKDKPMRWHCGFPNKVL